MKNIILGTTGLVGAALLAASASAQTPKVTVGGFADFQAGYIDDDLDAGQRDYGFRNDTEVSISVDGKSDNGLGYGAVIDLEADVTADADNEGLNASRTYVYMDGGWGRFELGSNQGVGATMNIDADNLAVATGGINGSWNYFANHPAGVAFIATPENVSELGSAFASGNESTDNSNKINYYSPRFSGFQLGVSYTPDLNDRGQFVSRSDIGTSAGDVFDLALSYERQFDAFLLGLSGNYQTGDGDTLSEDIDAYQVGAMLGFAGFSVAGSYADLEGVQGAGIGAEGDYYTLGAGYENGPFGLSATWIDSTLEQAAGDNDFENLVIGADYKLAPGLTPYAELSFYEYDAAGAAADNDGTLFILGTQLAF
ncbi:MAG: hypothetical protein CMM93_02215 [Rickettsiales bacterium]|nr:hypothetical protein [Rickettsiales bacterium]|tara:strand:+ start:4116 stop:5222 length:1107 start_codon:yes stop_codon:yes gene_type:complete